MQLGFTVCLSQEILAREVATQQIEQLDAFHIWVWNPGSKTIVLSMWQEYSSHLPPENFSAQCPFLQKLADTFKTPLPRHMQNRKIHEILHVEFYRLKNDCPRSRFPGDLDPHLAKLEALMLAVQRGTSEGPPTHFNCRSSLPEPSSFIPTIIERTRRRLSETIGRSLEEEFRRRVYGEPPPPQADNLDHVVDSLQYMAAASSLPAESIQRAVVVMSRSGLDITKNNRFRTMENIQREHPRWKLGEVDAELKKRGFQPSLDHEESKVMPGISKGVAGYIMLNDKLKLLLDRFCDLNTWKPDV